MSGKRRSAADAGKAVAVRFLRDVVACAAISWLSIAPLYAFDVRPLPEPAVAATAATLMAVLAAALPLTGRTAWVLPDVRTYASVHPTPMSTSRGEQYERAPAAANPPTSTLAPTLTLAAAPSPPGPRRPVDPSVFARRSETERQCPGCGGFAVTAADGPETHGVRCQTCNTAWSPPIAPTFVVVRSWLHH